MNFESNRDPRSLNIRVPVIVMLLAATAVPVQLRPFSADSLDLTFNPYDIVANLVGYVPVGIVLAGLGSLPGIALSALLSTMAETCQFFMVNRSPSPVDLILNIIGAMVGVAAARRLHINDTIIIHKSVALITTTLAVTLLCVAALPGSSTRLTNWDPAALLAVGDELTRDRPWYGEITELVIVAEALDSERIRRIAREQSLATLLSTPVFGPLRNVDLGQIRGESLLDSSELQRFHERITSQNTFTVLIRLKTERADQIGPARIVTYSIDPFLRNFTLAQDNRSLVFRIRTPTSGLNGDSPQLRTEPVLEANTEAFVAASFDGYISRVFVDGRLRGRTNLSAAGRPIPDFGGTILNLFTVTLGLLVAVALTGFWRPAGHSTSRAACLAAGLMAGCLLVLTGGVSAEPSHQVWVPVLSLAGGAAVAASLFRPRR